jgi:HEAT repeat protein
MLDWLKDKIRQGADAGERLLWAKAVREHFAPLEKMKGTRQGIGDRLARFVVYGEDQNSLNEVACPQSSSQFGIGQIIYYAGERGQFSKGLGILLKVLPEDPELYLRLALAYSAISQANRTGSMAAHFSHIPGFHGAHRWLAVFLEELAYAGSKDETFFPVGLLQAMIVAKDEAPSVLVRGALIVQDQQGKNQLSRWRQPPYTYFRCLAGLEAAILASPEIVREALQQRDASARAYTLQALMALKVSVEPFRVEIAAMAVSSSKEVREKAEPILKGQFSLFQPLMEKLAETGTSDERFQAVRMLSRIGGDSARAFLSRRLDVEKSAKVREAIREASGEGGQQDDGAGAEDFDLQPVSDVPVRAPLEKEVLTDLRKCVEEFEKKAAEDFARNKWAQAHNKKRTPVSPAVAERLFDALEDFTVKEGQSWQFIELSHWGSASQILFRFAGHPKFGLIHVVRWCLLLAGRAKNPNVANWPRWSLTYFWWREPLLAYQKARKEPIDLRELAAVFRTVGLDESIIGEHFLELNRWASSPLFRTEPDRIWPYFAERQELLERALGLKQVIEERPAIYYREKEHRENAFSLLKLFPRLPAKFAPLLWELACGSSKVERRLAQECLASIPGKEQKIVAALTSRQQHVRLAAAQWLADLNYREAVPGLRAALDKEKSEVVKDELIRALEALGVNLEELVDLGALDDEAEKGLKKGLPTDLEWFPLEQLPTVRWMDSGKSVTPEIVKWFLVQGCRLGNAEASPTLRRYCSLFQKQDREKLGRFVLEAWIAKDTKPKYTAEQAAALAQKETQQTVAIVKQHPKYYPDFDEPKHYQAVFNRLLIQPEGSQTSTKGILAVAGACCGADAAPIVHRYIKQWFGYRPAQGKALLQVLAWVDHPGAIQVVLAVANRFRTKGIQEEAMRQCELLAERKGWTLDELADRTIPAAGLDEDGVLELDYGTRVFAAKLSEEMTLLLTNPNGKTISSLPDPNQSDHPEKANQAKTILSASRKELKSVLSMQKDRLYEALCTQRTWRFEEWDTYLRKHPIVGRYCQRLVWAVREGDELKTSFRPLSDGSLTDHHDEEVRVDAESIICLAHEETLPPSERAAWMQHFSDYKVEPLFQQFGKATFSLPENLKEAGEITEFLGHIVKAFSLRNRLTRLGYTRGAAQDGGWFFDYRKTFPRLGLEAVIEFTGNGLPEENRTVALQRLHFVRKRPDGEPSMPQEVALGELPRVLLSECWNDIRMAAAEGPGFAADWEKQTEM